MLVVAKQAGTDLAVSRESNAVAVSAKGLRDRGDNPDLAAPLPRDHRVDVSEGLLEGRRVSGYLDWICLRISLPETTWSLPSLPGVKGHELDEAHDDVLIQGKFGQLHDFVVVKPPNNHSVDFQGGEANRLGQLYRFEHFRLDRHDR